MSGPPSPTDPPNSLFLRLGHWFEARGTGWGVAAIPLLMLLIAAVALARVLG